LFKRIRPTLLDGPGAEKIARRHLLNAGLKYLTANFRTPRGEIDLIMQDGEYLVFVEVRYRNSDAFGSADESVTPKKQQRLILAAQAYLQRNNLCDKVGCRFDVVSIMPDAETGRHRITWQRDAFQSGY